MESRAKLSVKALLVTLFLVGTILMSGCSKKDERTALGAALGAGVGAGIGAAAGGGGGAAAGGAIGAVTGGVIGRSTAD